MCPFLRAHVSPWLIEHFGSVPIFAGPADLNNLLAAGLNLGLMILPFITAVTREVLLAIPSGFREASMGLGATKWETIRSAILPASTSGIMGATVLGLGRAVGETMAAVMVIGSDMHIKASILQAGYSMPALLANKFGEADNEMSRSALLEIALILFAMTLLLNMLARLLIRLTSKTGAQSESATWVQITKKAFGTSGKFVVYVGLAGCLLLQTFSDLRNKGIGGIFGPVELVAAGYCAIHFLSARLCETPRWGTFRKANDFVMRSMAGFTAILACTGLFLVLGYVIMTGAPGLNLNLLTKLPQSSPGGGLKHAILGTMTLVGLASVIGIPLGVFGGIFLSEYHFLQWQSRIHQRHDKRIPWQARNYPFVAIPNPREVEGMSASSQLCSATPKSLPSATRHHRWTMAKVGKKETLVRGKPVVSDPTGLF
jgi:ABC-type phosphate transport system permease subunit